MKKVLLGLLALSAVSMAAAPDLGATPTADTNVFQTGQEGKIAVTGTITTSIPLIKYVIYASPDGTSDISDTLALTDFVMAQDTTSAGFAGTNPNVYVKRVNGAVGAETIVNLHPSETVQFKLNVDPFYTDATAVVSSWIGTTQSTYINPTALITKSSLESIYSGLPVTNTGTYGNANVRYQSRKSVSMTVESQGVLKFSNINTASSTLPSDQTVAIEAAFAGGHPVSGTSVSARIM